MNISAHAPNLDHFKTPEVEVQNPWKATESSPEQDVEAVFGGGAGQALETETSQQKEGRRAEEEKMKTEKQEKEQESPSKDEN